MDLTNYLRVDSGDKLDLKKRSDQGSTSGEGSLKPMRRPDHGASVIASKSIWILVYHFQVNTSLESLIFYHFNFDVEEHPPSNKALRISKSTL